MVMQYEQTKMDKKNETTGIDYIAYAVTDSEKIDEKTKKPISRWKAIGVVFKNKGNSFTVLLDAVPLSGKLVLMPPKEYAE